MANKLIFVAIIASLFLIACTNSNSNNSSSNVSYSISGDTININSKNGTPVNVSLTIADESISFSTDGSGKYTILSIIRQRSQNKNDIALNAAKNNNKISATIKVADFPDTTISIVLTPFQTAKSASISGNCAPLISKSEDPNFDVNLKKWLFRKGEHLEEDVINQVIGIAKSLNQSGYVDYITSAQIPVLQSFSGNSYAVSSNMKADHYVLFACNSQKEIDDFVEEIVSNNYELTSNSLNGRMNCFRPSNGNGYRCITLIGINKDWSYQQVPLGLIAIDNIPPTESFSDNTRDYSCITLKDNVRIYLPSNKPTIYGNASISVPHWDGNGLSCNVTFTLSFYGDVKSFTIKRTPDLCYHYGSGMGFYEKTTPQNKTIYTKGITSPHTFTYTLHFEGGDNLIPYEIEDYHGNRVEGKLNVRAEFVRNNAPTIENNIDIYN